VCHRRDLVDADLERDVVEIDVAALLDPPVQTYIAVSAALPAVKASISDLLEARTDETGLRRDHPRFERREGHDQFERRTRRILAGDHLVGHRRLGIAEVFPPELAIDAFAEHLRIEGRR